jgi:hypothetical protein
MNNGMNQMQRDELPRGVWGKNKSFSRFLPQNGLFCKIIFFSRGTFGVLGFILLHLVHFFNIRSVPGGLTHG